MNKLIKFLICTGIISPFCASAQLITITDPSSSGSFQFLINTMAADQAALYIGPGEANASAFTELYWDSSEFKWVTGSLSTDVADLNFSLISENNQYFTLTGPSINVGFVANENWDVDELFVNAYAPDDLGNSNPRASLFNYSDVAVGDDAPGDTAEIKLANGVDAPVVLEFEHINQTQTPGGSVYQSNEIRFNMFQGVSVDNQGTVTGVIDDQWLFGINDRNRAFDQDRDDGYFYLTGDISPVPEPSQIAALSLLGLGALLIVRRRLVKRNKK